MELAPQRVEETQKAKPNSLIKWLWRVFLAVDVPLLLAVLLAIGAVVLHPRPFWLAQLLAVTLPYLVIPTGIAMVVAILFRKWGWVGLHVILLLLVGLRTFPLDRFTTQQTPGADDLTVMSFNVPQHGPSSEALGDSMIALARRIEPDIIGLQEAWVVGAERGEPGRRPPQVSSLVDSLDFSLATPTRMSSQAAWNRNATQVPMLFHQGVGEVEVIEQEALQLSEIPDDDVSVAIRTHFRWHEREGVIYNIHLRSFGVNKPWEDRISLSEPGTWLPYLRQYRSVYRSRAAEVEVLLERIEAETLPVIVMGDFNGTSGNWTVRKLRGNRTDAFRVAGTGPGHTYRADKPVVRIDFVFVDQAWSVIDADVPTVRFSDHLPVVVRLRWADEEPAL